MQGDIQEAIFSKKWPKNPVKTALCSHSSLQCLDQDLKYGLVLGDNKCKYKVLTHSSLKSLDQDSKIWSSPKCQQIQEQNTRTLEFKNCLHQDLKYGTDLNIDKFKYKILISMSQNQSRSGLKIWSRLEYNKVQVQSTHTFLRVL